MSIQKFAQPGSFVVGCNYWASHAGTAMWTDWRADVVEEDLRQLADAGLQVLRIFPLWPDFQPIHLLRGGAGQPREIRCGEQPLGDDEIGQAGVSLEALEHFQTFLDLAQKYQLKLIVGLVTGWMSGRLFVPPALEGLNVLTDPTAILWETRLVRCLVRRFRDHLAVLAWDLGNECNVMASVPSRDAAWAWVSAITSAIRAIDPTRPIVSGMHGGLDFWPPETLGELTDLLTTHPYPIWTAHCDQDPVNTIRTILHSTAESLFYAGVGGKPCLAEELGTLGPFIASDEIAADFVRSCLYSLWAHDCQGLLWWCAYDQEHLVNAPYDWNTCERELGLFRSNRLAKPVIHELGNFRSMLEKLPFDRLPAHPTEAVCLLSLDQDQWGAAYSSYILSRQAGFELEFQSGEQPLKPADLYLVPSVCGVNVVTRRRWLELLERVRQGATLYLSLDDAILAGFQETFGLKPLTRQRRSDPVRFNLPDAGSFTIPAPFRLGLQPDGADLLAQEEDGNPVFTHFSYGKGEVYFLSVPVERVLTETPAGFTNAGAQPWWKVYRLVAQKILARRAVHKDAPLLGISEHALSPSKRIVVGINYDSQPLSAQLELASGWKTGLVFHGSLQPGQDRVTFSIKANEAIIFEIIR
jgi:hypothetical protein